MNVTSVKLCRVVNSCWNVKDKKLEISNYLYEGSTIPSDSDPYFTNLSGMRENYAFVWNPSQFDKRNHSDKELSVAILEGQPALLIKRYFATNTMHLLHDEILPGLASILHHKNLRESNGNRLIITLDDGVPSETDIMMTWLGQFWGMNHLQATIRFRNGLKPTQNLDYICFKEAYIGMDSLSTSWYQYGFEVPQGPIEGIDRELVGKNVRIAIEWIKDQIYQFFEIEKSKLTESEVLEALNSLKSVTTTKGNLEKGPVILIASRTRTRLILNEPELARKLHEAFPSASEITFIRQETSEIEDLIVKISSAAVLIGMHGALLALAAFLPPGAMLIELFPFGIPAENYSPYKTLAGLPEMRIKYAAWVNKREDEPFNVGHPDRTIYYGGLKGFPESYRHGIKATKTVPSHRCCYSPFWLFRIFQDTVVNYEEVINLIKDLL